MFAQTAAQRLRPGRKSQSCSAHSARTMLSRGRSNKCTQVPFAWRVQEGFRLRDLHTPALKPAEKRKVGAGGAATCERLLQAPDNPGSGSVRSGRCCRAGGEAQRQRLGCLQLGVCPVRLSCIGMRPSIRAKRLRNDSSWEACLWQSMQLWQLGRTKIAEVMHCRQGKVQKRRMLKLRICSRL